MKAGSCWPACTCRKAALRWFAGEAEGFVNKKPDGASTTEALDEIARFVRARCGSAGMAR